MSQKIVVKVDQELKDLIPTYLENRETELALLRKLAEGQDSKGISVITHKLKGNAAAYGFDWLGEVAAKIESSLKAGQWNDVTKKLDEIEHYLNHIEIEFVEVKE